jgi:hypothetical protein
MSSAVQQLAVKLNRLEREVRARATTSYLAYSSIEDGGSIDSNASDGTTMAQFGGQFDGSFGASSFIGPMPPTPSVPVVTPAPGGLTVQWDGLFTDALNAPMDFSRVEVHASTVSGFVPDMASTLWTTIESPRGGVVPLRLPIALYYVKLVARSFSGRAGPGSEEGFGTSLGGVSDTDLTAYEHKFQVNAADYATPQLAADAVATGGRLFFPPGTYALTAAISIPVDGVHVDAMGAIFTQSTWGQAGFDLLGVNGCTLDIGLVRYVGTRGGITGSFRGGAPYIFGAGVWTNGDRNYVRNLRTIGMPVAVNFNSWDGSSATGHLGIGNHAGKIEAEGYDFAIFWVGQQDLVVDDLYAHDDIDDSSGGNPTHAYYCSATAAFRSTGTIIHKARCENNLYGFAFQIKNSDSIQLTSHSANNCAGLINIVDCNDLSWVKMQGTAMLVTGGGRNVTLQTLATNCQRPILTDTSVIMATGQDEGAVTIIADDAQINGFVIEAHRPVTGNTGMSEIYTQGNRGRIRGLTIRSRGLAHGMGIEHGYITSPATNWVIEDVIVENTRSVVAVSTNSSGTSISYDPKAQVLIGAGAQITGASTDYHIVGALLTGQVNSTAPLTLTGTPTDLTNATVTFTAALAGQVLVTAIFDVSPAVGGEIIGGYLSVDAANMSQLALINGTGRLTIAQTWAVPLAVGSHTLKLQGALIVGSNTGHVINGTHSGFTYQFIPGA